MGEHGAPAGAGRRTSRPRSWVDEAPLAPPALRCDSALRLFFGQHARPGRLEEIIDEHRAAVQQALDELDAVRAVLAAGGPPEDTSEEVGRSALADAVAVWGQRRRRSDLAPDPPAPGGAGGHGAAWPLAVTGPRAARLRGSAPWPALR